MHVAKPMEALDRMIRAVRPGGSICIEEGDYGLFAAIDPTNPAAERFTQKMGAVFTALHRAGVWDPCFGRRVRGLLESAGLLDVGHDGATWVSRGGEAGARFHRMSLALVRQPMIAERVLTDDDYAVLDQLYEDPFFEFVGPVIFAAWGRR
jgi:hypothetical protein